MPNLTYSSLFVGLPVSQWQRRGRGSSGRGCVNQILDSRNMYSQSMLMLQILVAVVILLPSKSESRHFRVSLQLQWLETPSEVWIADKLEMRQNVTIVWLLKVSLSF